MHYALHHTQLPAYLREQKRYHLAHHYKNFELGFGVTSESRVGVLFSIPFHSILSLFDFPGVCDSLSFARTVSIS